ncbi:hypothetical protein D4764_11G0003260 [Takifugu flavidus]|uniref:Uncharacterized protein n=1 Tax=Takifugu flavidus TaxID=433684 RepID=A0A5C6PFQ4_9TELE|nr:hypothetical protein D4764_11G0003260 [Takifugu flavidus]
MGSLLEPRLTPRATKHKTRVPSARMSVGEGWKQQDRNERTKEVASRHYWRQINYKITTNWISATPPETVIISTATITQEPPNFNKRRMAEVLRQNVLEICN